MSMQKIIPIIFIALIIFSGCNINISISDDHKHADIAVDGASDHESNQENINDEQIKDDQNNHETATQDIEDENKQENEKPAEASFEEPLENDFALQGFCGDGICSENENSESCCNDCGCQQGEVCDGICKKALVLAPLQFNGVYQGPKQKEPLLNQLSTKDYLVITITKIEKITNKNYDKNDFEEYLLYTSARNNGDVQMFKYPVKGTYFKRYINNNQNRDLFMIDTDKYGETSQVPIFSKSSLENKPIDLHIVIAEIDKPMVSERITYTDDDEENIAVLYDGNDILFDKEIMIRPPYTPGTFTIRSDAIAVTYKVQKLKGLNGINTKYKVSITKAMLKKGVDGKTGPKSDVYNPSSLLLLTRVADGFQWDDFGVNAVYDNSQVADGFAFGGVGVGSNVYHGLNELRIKSSYENNIAGPFVYYEINVYDVDDTCLEKTGHNEKWYCYLAEKYAPIALVKRFYTSEELVNLYDKGTYDINSSYSNSFMDLKSSLKVIEISS